MSSEFLRTQQGVDQIDHQKKADQQHENVFKVHQEPLLELVARDRVGDRDDKERDGAKNHQYISHCGPFSETKFRP